MKRPEQERGVALLTVLLLVAVMATFAAAVLEDIRFGLRRSANAAAVGQARWYAIGAEALASAQIRRLFDAEGGRTTLRGDWNGRQFRFPVEGGLIEAQLTDGVSCFNLNSVVVGTPGAYAQNPIGIRQFIALAKASGVADGEAMALAGALVDWIDSDARRIEFGAEDEAYAREAEAYRTGGTLLAEVSELRAIRGFNQQVLTKLRPHTCALPVAETSPINVNTLREDDAVLLTALTEGKLSVAAARRVIAARPAAGWDDLYDFWRAVPEDARSEQTKVEFRSRYFNLATNITLGDAEVATSALLEQDQSGAVKLVARRWTRDE